MSFNIINNYSEEENRVRFYNSISDVSMLHRLEEKFSVKDFHHSSALSHVDIFLLCEPVGSTRCYNPTNGELISFLASRGKIILFMEHFELFQEVVDELTITQIMHNLHIDPKVRKEIRFLGWDVKKSAEMEKTLQDWLSLKTLITLDDQFLEFANYDNFCQQCPIVRKNMLSTLEGIVKRKAHFNYLSLSLDAQIKNMLPFQAQNIIAALQIAELFEGKVVFQCGHSLVHQLPSVYNKLTQHQAVTLIPKDIG